MKKASTRGSRFMIFKIQEGLLTNVQEYIHVIKGVSGLYPRFKNQSF